jgi:glycosyltransferase involved in cell wall biosynthesis
MSNVGFHPFRLLNLNTLDKIFTVSEKGKKYHIEKFGNNYNNIETAYLGTSSPKLKPKEPIETDFDITIVSVSSVIPLKRVLLIPLILSKIDNIRINWIHFGEGVLFDELKTTTTDLLDKKKNIEYQLMGNVSNEELINYYSENNVDLFLSLSSSEGIPVSMMEAMSFGIPVISTDVGGISELVKSNNGFLVNSSVNYDEIISIINSYNEMDSTSKKEISNNAINHWNKNFNAEENFPIFAKQLKELL